MKKITPEISDAIAETLFITLLMRAYDSQCDKPILNDVKSRELVEKIDYPFDKLGKSSLMSQIGVNVRFRYFDQKVELFIERNDSPVVVLIGCGLDTRFERISNASKAVFYELDLPEVMTLRQKLLPENEHDLFIAQSVFESEWAEEIKSKHADSQFIFVIEGVLPYFTEEEVKTVFCLIADKFPGATIYFDAISIYLSKQSARHDTVKKMRAVFKWGIDDDRLLETWHSALKHESTESIMVGMKPYHWLPRLLCVFAKFRNGSKMLGYKVSESKA